MEAMDGARTRLQWEEPREDVKLQTETNDEYCKQMMCASVYVTEKDLTTAATLTGDDRFVPVSYTHLTLPTTPYV